MVTTEKTACAFNANGLSTGGRFVLVHLAAMLRALAVAGREVCWASLAEVVRSAYDGQVMWELRNLPDLLVLDYSVDNQIVPALPHRPRNCLVA